MDSKQQLQSKKPLQGGEQQQLGKENKQQGQDFGKDFGKDGKQQDLGKQQQQGLGAGSDVNQRGKEVGSKQQAGQDLNQRGRDIGGQQQQKASPGDDIPVKGGQKAKKDAIGVDKSQEFPDSKQPMAQKNCSCCKRHFFADRIAKHEKACQQAHKKRSKFDIRAKRLAGLEISQKQQSSPQPAKGAAPSKGAASRSAWRQKNDEFLSQIRSAKKGKGKGRRADKFDAEVKVPARQPQRGLGNQGAQPKDVKQQKDSKQLQGLEGNQQKGGLAGQGASRGEEAPLGAKQGKVASDNQPSRQSYNQPTR